MAKVSANFRKFHWHDACPVLLGWIREEAEFCLGWYSHPEQGWVIDG